MTDLGNEGARKDLPTEERFSNETQRDVETLPVHIVDPFALCFVLLVLNDCKTIE